MLQFKPFLIFLLAALLMNTGCTSRQQEVAEEIDFGTTVGRLYSNKFFKLKVTFPENWSVQNRQEIGQVIKLGEDFITEGKDQKSKDLKAAIKASSLTTVQLFMIFKHPVGMPVSFNPNIICTAEKSKHAKKRNITKRYLSQIKNFLSESKMRASLFEEIATSTLGGKEFSSMGMMMHLGDLTVKQRYYVIAEKGYLLTFILSFTIDEEKEELQKVLDTIRFE